MKFPVLVASIILAVFSLGCTSDETAICERLDECNLLPAGTSVEDCEEDAEDIDDPGECRECVEDESCSDLGQCLNDCEL